MTRLRQHREADPARSKHWPRLWLVLCGVPAVAGVTAAGLNRLWPGSFSLDALLAVSPALAGIGASAVRRPLSYGAVATALAVTGAVLSGAQPLSAGFIIPVTGVLCITILSTLGVRYSPAAQTGQRLADVTSVAEAAQRALLRPMPAQVGPLKLSVLYLAAAAEAAVGGDLYEVADTRHGIRVIIGDVRGKGLGAIELAADVLGTFREVAHEVYTLTELARRLDVGLSRHSRGPEDFVTAVLVEINTQSGELSIYNCGHPAPVLLRSDGAGVRRRFATPLEVPAPAPPLRLMSMGDCSRASRTVAFRPGAALLLYTDGVTEARDAQQRFYPLTERLARLAGEHRRGRRSGLLDRVRDDLLQHVGAPLEDDAALVLIQSPAAWADRTLDTATAAEQLSASA